MSPAELDVARPLKQAFDRVSNLQPCTTHVAELVVVLPLWYFICWWVGPLAVSSALASTVAKAWDCHISCAVCTGWLLICTTATTSVHPRHENSAAELWVGLHLLLHCTAVGRSNDVAHALVV